MTLVLAPDARPERGRYLHLPVLLSATRTELGSRCRRRHVLSDIIQLERNDAAGSPSALFGTHMHNAAQAMWLMQDADKDTQLEAALHAGDRSWEENGASDIVFDGKRNYHTKELLETCIREYVRSAEVAPGMPGEWKVVAVEERLSVNVNGFILPFQIDRLVQSQEDGSLAIVDLKTASRMDSRWDFNMRKSIQQRIYRWAAQKHYEEDVSWSIIECLQKRDNVLYGHVQPAWSQEQINEAMDLFMRHARLDEMFIQHLHATYDADELLNGAIMEAVHMPDFNYMDCMSYFTPCPYIDICEADPRDRGELVDMDYHVTEKPWHDEDAVGLNSLLGKKFSPVEVPE